MAKVLLLLWLQNLLGSGGSGPGESAEPATDPREAPCSARGAAVFRLLSRSRICPLQFSHFALESRLQIFPLQMPSWGVLLPTLKGSLQPGLTGPRCCGALLRDPRNSSTKCLFFHSCHHLKRNFAASEKCGGSILMHYCKMFAHSESIVCTCVVILPVAKCHGQAPLGVCFLPVLRFGSARKDVPA